MNSFLQKIFIMNLLLFYSIESFHLDKFQHIYLSSSQLHRPSDSNRNRENPLLNFLRSSFVVSSISTKTNNDHQRIYSHFHRQRSSNDNDDDQYEKPLIVQMHIEPKEKIETKFVRLFIDTKHRQI